MVLKTKFRKQKMAPFVTQLTLTLVDSVTEVALPSPRIHKVNKGIDVCATGPTADNNTGLNHRKLLQ